MQVTVFEASDGTFHKTFEAFQAHEEAILIGKNIGHIGFDLTNVAVEMNEDGALGIPVASIPAFVKTNAKVLRELLNASVIKPIKRKRGPNKPKAVVA